jgi:phosphoesterase family protein
MKENRTYDQILGDLGEGNGDPRLTMFPQKITPNFHSIATQFVDLDNWYMSSDVSGDGWNWGQQGHANDYTNKSVPVSYAGGGFDFEWNGTVRNDDVGLPVFSSNPSETNERMTEIADPSGKSNIQPGPKDIAATWGAGDESPGQTGGYIWDSVIRAGLSYRMYGQYCDQTFYDAPNGKYTIPIVRDAWKTRTAQCAVTESGIGNNFDRYYRGWDLNTPDEWRFEEWNHEFQSYVKSGNMPSFETVLFHMDHMGDFSSNVEGLANPDDDQASDDHAVGELVDAVSHSPYWNSTAIFVLEDDSQDGPDHVDSHRSTAYVMSPWVKHRGIVHTMYTDGNMLTTMEDILGFDHLGMNDANAAPMDDVFSMTADNSPYDVIIPGVLCKPPVHPDLVPECRTSHHRTDAPPPLESPQWWSQKTKHYSWTGPDQNDPNAFNRLVWEGTMGAHVPYPAERNGADLSDDRARVLAALKVPGIDR